MSRNLHRIAGALERLKHEAATGPCLLSRCSATSVGYIMGTSWRPAGVCAEHKPDAEARGWTVWPDPLRRPEHTKKEAPRAVTRTADPAQGQPLVARGASRLGGGGARPKVCAPTERSREHPPASTLLDGRNRPVRRFRPHPPAR